MLRRRWRVMVAGVLVTGAALVGILFAVPKTFVAEGEYIFMLPAQTKAGADIGLQNPYLGFGGSLNVVTFVVARAMAGQAEADAVAKAGGDSEYVVDLVPGDAPMVSISVKGTSEREAMATYAVLERELTAQLARMQTSAGAPRALQIISVPVRTPERAEVQRSSQIRIAAGVLVLGGVITLLLAFFAESLASHGPHAAPRPGAPSCADSSTERALEPGPPAQPPGLQRRGRATEARWSRSRRNSQAPPQPDRRPCGAEPTLTRRGLQ